MTSVDPNIAVILRCAVDCFTATSMDTTAAKLISHVQYNAPRF